MRIPKTIILLFLLFFVTALSALAAPVTIRVSPNDATCITTSDPPCHSTIQSAIDNAANLASINTGTTYDVLVEPGTYSGAITLKSGISVKGRETARTIINAGSSETAITANAVTGTITLSNFTIINASIGVDILGNSTVKIKNNVFNLGLNGTAIRIQSSPSSEVINNTFYQNGIAISRDSDMSVVNNIFSQNTTDISQTIGTVTNIYYNLFDPDNPVGSNAIPNATVTNADPLFVASSSSIRDFHVKENSPAKDAGTDFNGPDSFDATTSDLGAYGGPGSDKLPYPLAKPSVSLISSSTASVVWAPNLAYTVTNTNPAYRGSYYVHFKFGIAGPPYDNTINIISTETSTLFSGLTGTVTPPAAPVLNPLEYADKKLIVSWSPVSNVAGYIIHYENITAGTPVQDLDVGNTNFYVLTGLINGETYRVTVTAYLQPAYHFSVTAADYKNNESAYSPEEIISVGSVVEGPPSNPEEEAPDLIIANPNLPDSGCFIATAAYGYYSAPQVQALRDFRDRYLVNNRPGKAFVSWYYRNGPAAAAFINNHPRLKPLVRAALLPAVGASLFLVNTPFSVKIATVLLLVALTTFLVHRRRRSLLRGDER